MANYKYEVLFNGDIPVKVNTLEEAEKLKLKEIRKRSPQWFNDN